jgi:hypothetical protein
MLNAVATKSIGIWLMNVLNPYDQKQDPRLLKQGKLLTLDSFLINTYIIRREFNKFLKVDRAKYGVGENYVIEDTVTDEWQRRVDDVVAEQSSYNFL